MALAPAKSLATRILPLLALATCACLAVTYIVFSIYWRSHDNYDDTGYMLAIFNQLSAGGVLYQQVYSQYGPFHGQAWNSFFKLFHLSIDHNHVGLGVILFWSASSALAGLWAWLATRQAMAAALAIAWCTWAMLGLRGELGHPISLCMVLTLSAVVAGSLDRVSSRVQVWGRALGGLAIAALLLTKINLGVFSGMAIGLALLIAWDRTKYLAMTAGAASLLAPFLLLNKAWDLEIRLLLAVSLDFPLLMILLMEWSQRQGKDTTGSQPRRWFAEALCWGGGFILGIACILSLTVVQGTSLPEILSGVVKRPLQLSGQFAIPPEVRALDYVSLAISVALAAWWARCQWRRSGRPAAWATIITLVGGAVLFSDRVLSTSWSVGQISLLWLPLSLWQGFWPSPAAASLTSRAEDGASLESASPSESWAHTRGPFLVVALSALWQSLGTYPVAGAQTSLPSMLAVLLWTATLYGLAQQQFPGPAASLVKNLPRTLVKVWPAALLLALTGFHMLSLQDEIQWKRVKFVKTVLPGTDRFSLPMIQCAALETVSRNIADAPGPLFTLHGQNSFNLWARKPWLTGFNCTHITGTLEPQELRANLDALRQHPQWTAIILSDGDLFGKGPLYPETRAFIEQGTQPWFQVQDYEVRRTVKTPAPALQHAVWQDGAGKWHLSVPAAAARKARKWRLRKDLQLASGRWERLAAPTATPLLTTPKMASAQDSEEITLPLPEAAVAALEKQPPGDRQFASFWLCDTKWLSIAGVAVVKVQHSPSR